MKTYMTYWQMVQEHVVWLGDEVVVPITVAEAIPEPQSLLLLGIGMTGLLSCTWWRRRYSIAFLLAVFVFTSAVCAAETTDKTSPLVLTIALLQMESKDDDQGANLRIADHYCRQAAQRGADIALMPEMWNIGYADYPGQTRKDLDKWTAKAVSRDGDYVQYFVSLAKELNMAIVVTFLEKWPKAPRNAAALIDRHGTLLFTYAKVHTCDFGKREASCTPGDDFYVGELDTAKGKIAVGIMTCYDREHPESARVLMLKGAELILTPNACFLDRLRLDQFKTRAYENALVVAMANYPKGHGSMNGQSVSFDANGNALVQPQEEEGIYLASFDIAVLRKHRKDTIWGDAYRRPHRYRAILYSQKPPVFERNNAFGDKFEADKR